jgi:hypothetical protein
MKTKTLLKQLHELLFFMFLQRNGKLVFHNSLTHFSLSAMHKAVGDIILPNNLYKIAQIHLESCS